MQVTSDTGSLTHAVFGQASGEKFSISNSPEFFQILSKNIYTQPELAVVRELMCNAWDAHIAAGIDKHIQVNVAPNTEGILTLTIKDFGMGIPHDKIQEIFMTYGQSTKTADGNQTGGLGLGCKSPFAIVDDFTVINCNSGIKVTHIMQRASNMHGGAPGSLEIGREPTEETGVTIEVPVGKHRTNKSYWIEFIKSISFFGSIKTECNDEILEYVKVPNQGAWLDVSHLHSWGTGANPVFIQYGAVAYRIPHEYYDSHSIRHMYEWNPNNTILVLKAPPHSLNVSTSRESLNFDDKTKETIKDLVDSAVKQFTQDYFVKLSCVNAINILNKAYDLDPSRKYLLGKNIFALSLFDEFAKRTYVEIFKTYLHDVAIRFPEKKSDAQWWLNQLRFTPEKKDMLNLLTKFIVRKFKHRGVSIRTKVNTFTSNIREYYLTAYEAFNNDFAVSCNKQTNKVLVVMPVVKNKEHVLKLRVVLPSFGSRVVDVMPTYAEPKKKTTEEKIKEAETLKAMFSGKTHVVYLTRSERVSTYFGGKYRCMSRIRQYLEEHSSSHKLAIVRTKAELKNALKAGLKEDITELIQPIVDAYHQYVVPYEESMCKFPNPGTLPTSINRLWEFKNFLKRRNLDISQFNLCMLAKSLDKDGVETIGYSHLNPNVPTASLTDEELKSIQAFSKDSVKLTDMFDRAYNSWDIETMLEWNIELNKLREKFLKMKGNQS